jgi:hypothetical protein
VPPRSNLYAGQSIPGLTYNWQTTPAFILASLVSDYSSSKVGHRQGILCPNLASPSFGHICYRDASTTRYFCGGCQHIDGRNADSLPPKVTCDAPSGFVAWPPHGAVPTETLSAADWMRWSFATFEPTAGAFNSFTVEVNGAAVSATRYEVLCTGSGMSDAAGRTLVWIGFKPPTYSAGQTLTVVVRAGSSARWTYSVTPVECNAAARPGTVAIATCSATTAPPPTPLPTPPVPPPPVPTPPIPAGYDLCQAQMDVCWKNCGRPRYYPFTCSGNFWTNEIYYCYTPDECPECAPCQKMGCASCNWATLSPGTLAWCNCCANNCDGNRQNCITQQWAMCTRTCDSLLLCNPANNPINQLTAGGSTTTTTSTTTTRSPTPVPTTTTRPPPGITPSPTPPPTPAPTPFPTPRPTPRPTPAPTPLPTPRPTPSPTAPPTPQQVCGDGTRQGSEQCDGGACCGTDCRFLAAFVQCRAATDLCDATEYCTGTSDSCPADSPAPANRVCRSAADACDVTEVCDGVSRSCPADRFSSAGTVCRASVAECDVAERCSGTQRSCPADAFAANTVVCRVASDVCDEVEFCSGSSAYCPFNAFKARFTVCRPSAGVCDVADTCTGTGASCPADARAPSTTQCRSSSGVCDVSEMCAGGIDCPADGVQPNSVVCRASVGACDVPDYCDGRTKTCGTDNVQSSSVLCRGVGGDCDIPEYCSGSSPSCPTDQFKTNLITCRAAISQCDVEERCPGTAARCPSDTRKPTGTACDDGDRCTAPDRCNSLTGQCESSPAALGGTCECRTAADCVSPSRTCANAVCSSGQCTYTPLPAGRSCRASAGACDSAEVCDGTSLTCPTDRFLASGSMCRAATGVCDEAETCTGSSPACPADLVKPFGAVCRASAGPCDNDEVCSGTSAACPADSFKTSSTICRASSGVCDVDERCPGNAAACPADALAPLGAVCRPAAGDCDIAETCSGTSRVCPVDVFRAASAVCRTAVSLCDIAETCSGTTPSCPTDRVERAGVQCRAAAGACDLPSVCDGSAATCAANALRPNSFVCRAASGECDVEERCNGAAAACPTDRFQPSNAPCRPVAGDCDVEELCTGNSAACPTDAFAPRTRLCRAARDDCDATEFCTGTTAVCPTDALKPVGALCNDRNECTSPDECQGDGRCKGRGECECYKDTDCDDFNECSTDRCVTGKCQYGVSPAGTLCRKSAGECDAPDYCTGESITCPFDSVRAATVICRASTGPCDPEEKCTGRARECPVDLFSPSTFVCRRAEDACDKSEMCTGTSAACPADELLPIGTVCRAASGLCDLAETCVGDKFCPYDRVQPRGTECRPTVGLCDMPESCDGTSAACPVDRVGRAGQLCRAINGECDVEEKCDGVTGVCPPDAVAGSERVCRVSRGTCDAEDRCSGTAPNCPEDARQPAGTVCRAPVGPCDAPETCTGSALSCPADTFQPAGAVCRAANGACDEEERCTGGAASCPNDTFKPSGVQCREAAGACDEAERCTGGAAACPNDAFAANGTVCRAASSAVCDAAERCDGRSAECPVDLVSSVEGSRCTLNALASQCGGVAPDGTCGPLGVCSVQLPATCSCSTNAHCNDNNPCTRDTCNVGSGRCFYTASPVGTVCRQAALGGCDATEVCDGASTVCPADRVAASGTLCRAKSDACDVEDVCDGQSSSCPADRLAPQGSVCRAATQACESNATCNGIDASCPLSAPRTAGTVCRAAVNAFCDREELCDGRSLVCGADVVVDGVPCNDGNACTSGDTCTGGQCTGQVTCECENSADCAPRNSVCASHTCDQAGRCVADVVKLPATCNDNDSCTINDACQEDGRCVGELGCPLVPPFMQSGVLSGSGDRGEVQLVACSGRGECCRGKCACSAGFVGDACERQMTAPPTPRPTMSTGNGGGGGDVGVGVGDNGNGTNAGDECPFNPLKVTAGPCGCAAGDSDLDGIDDCLDGDYLVTKGDSLQLNLYNPEMLMQLVGRVQLPSGSLDNSTGPHHVQAGVASDVRKFMLNRVPLRYGWALNLSVWHDADGMPTASAIDANNSAQVCLAPAVGYSSDPNLCLAAYVARLAEWRCVDERLAATADGLVCGTTSDLGMGNRQNWQLLTVMAKAQTGDFFAKLEEAFTSLLGDIGLPLWVAVVIGIGGFCCAIWLFCSSAWLTKRAYVEHKERRMWDGKLEQRRDRRHEIEALGDGGVSRRHDAAADGGVVDKFMAPVFQTLTPALAERERRDRQRNANAAKVLSDIDTNSGDVGLKPLRMGTTKFEGQKARDAKAKRDTSAGPRLEKHVSEWGWGAGVEAIGGGASSDRSDTQQTMSSPRGRSPGARLHDERKANAPTSGTETLRFHTIRAPDGTTVTMTRRGAQDSRPSRAAEREKRTMRRLERDHRRRTKSSTRESSKYESEQQVRDAFEVDIADAQSPLAQRGMETIVAAELAAWRSQLPTDIKKASATPAAKSRPVEALKEKNKADSARSESPSPKLERKATAAAAVSSERKSTAAAAAVSSTPKSERKASSGSPPPITIMPAPSAPAAGEGTAEQLMTMHIAGQRQQVAERLKSATPAVRKEFKQLLQARRTESMRDVGGAEHTVTLVAANSLETDDRTCTRCQAWLSGNVVAVGDHEFRHIPCFRCDECQAPLAKQFFKHGTRNLCKKCHDEE